MPTSVLRIDNEVIRFFAHIEANEADRRRLEALMAEAEGTDDILDFAQRLGFDFSRRALIDAIEQLQASAAHGGEAQRRAFRSPGEVFRLGRSVMRARAET